jgi:hypothetical protein
MRCSSSVTLISFFLFLAVASVVTADVPHQMQYQGHLTDSGGTPLDTMVSMTFTIYNDSSAGSLVLWTETQAGVEVSTGLFNVLLGSVTPIPDTVFASDWTWLGIQIGSDPEIVPRTKLVSVPYAFRIATVDGASGGVIFGGLGIGSTGMDVDGKLDISGPEDTDLIILETGGANRFSMTAHSSGSDYLSIRSKFENPDSDIVVFRGDGRVGIGTTTPSTKLDVSGDINVNSVYRIAGDQVLSTSGTRNVFVGIQAGENNGASDGTFVGYRAGRNNEGNFNTFLGRNVGASNTSGYGNTFVGYLAGGSNGTGYRNTFLGQDAGYFNTTGNVNTFVGDYAGFSNTTGNRNTFLGQQAGGSNTTGNYNTYLGYQAGQSAATDSGNVFIGYMAGFYATGSSKLYIANGSSASNTLIYGDFSTRRLGIGTTSPSEELHVVGDIYCTGKLTSVGGNDPPYVLYNKETRKAIIERVAHEVPKDKLDGAVLFWNGDEMRFEVYMPERGEFRDLQGNLLATVSELRGEQ